MPKSTSSSAPSAGPLIAACTSRTVTRRTSTRYTGAWKAIHARDSTIALPPMPSREFDVRGRRWNGRRSTSISVLRVLMPPATGPPPPAPRATLLFNHARLYNDRELGTVTLNASRLGEAPTGPIQLQEHGMPLEFRNIWVLESK